MSDDLVKLLRRPYGNLTFAEKKEAADRIEELEEILAKMQESQSYTHYGRDWEPVLARDLEARAAAAEVKLAKAVEVALEECPFRWGTPNYDNWWRDRRTTLAELKGEKDE